MRALLNRTGKQTEQENQPEPMPERRGTEAVQKLIGKPPLISLVIENHPVVSLVIENYPLSCSLLKTTPRLGRY